MYYVYLIPTFKDAAMLELPGLLAPTLYCFSKPLPGMNDVLIDIVDHKVTIDDYPELLI